MASNDRHADLWSRFISESIRVTFWRPQPEPCCSGSHTALLGNHTPIAVAAPLRKQFPKFGTLTEDA